YAGNPEDPKVSVQPMMCQHCDNAPCENVCPVVATNHSPDGLNQMVYNRCVGTRYCSNNCPYKVRRFNFFNFRDHFHDGHYTQPVMQLSANPEVTVRSRGVMEKCTFCVHRISDGRAEAAREGKVFNGAGITSACQDSCAANAIVFGNANDPDSHIAKLRAHNLGYGVLEELNVKPNVTYIAKLRNTHSEEV
ncbi:MAG: 4Fe-4S dicluster domain-containing protein, partial [Ignavibacteriales bacterium]|nr:4Fe-4S dicluster domain-containing protein [Ignavibacteriales bacterium]